MEYINIKEAALRWDVTPRRVQEMCAKGEIMGATRFGRAWMIPLDAQKPTDKRTKFAKAKDTDITKGFLMPCPRSNPFLIYTDLYNTPGTADELILSYSDYPETMKIIEAQFDCRRGNIDKVYKNSKHFIEQHGGFYSTISAGVTLSFCAIWRGDISLWQKARKHIYDAPCRSEEDINIIKFWLSVIDSNIKDVRNFPDWFEKGKFDCLPADSYPTARVFYVKRMLISAKDLASGKTEFPNVEKLGLMRTLPYVLEPLISQAMMERTVVPEAYLRLMAAIVYHDLGDDKSAIEHIDKAIELCIPDGLFCILAENVYSLDNLLDDRLLLHSEGAYNKVKRLYKIYNSGWIKLHNQLLERSVSEKLTKREREISKLAAMGLTNQEIATRLNIEVSSVKQYVFSAMNKVGVDKRNQLGMYI